MLYKLLHLPSRIALYFYCRKIIIHPPEIIKEGGPLLIAANHPNSFLDAILVNSLWKKPVYSLARGDVFSGKIISSILYRLNILPVYRLSEGAENIGNNYATFQRCRELFEQQQIVLIFSEGRSINEWRLRPLKKGTARVAIDAWENNIPLKVIPLGINYSSFRFFGKNVILNFGIPITEKDLPQSAVQGKRIASFNENLQQQLKKLVVEIDKDDRQKLKAVFQVSIPVFKRILLWIPAVAGFIANAPLYVAFHLIIHRYAKDHYDSIMAGLLFFIYPVYILAISLVVYSWSNSVYSFLLLILLPFTAWSYLQLKKQFRSREIAL